jgi:hypothetical protein
VIHRDYYMWVFILYPILARDTHIGPRAAEGQRADIPADMGRELIWGTI